MTAPVQSASAATTDQLGTSLSVNLPFTPTSGNLLTLHLTGDKATGTVTGPAGWTKAGQYSGTSVTGAAFWKVSAGSESGALTCTWTTAQGAAVIVAEHSLASPVFGAYAAFPNPVNDVATTSLAGTLAGDAGAASYIVAAAGIDSTNLNDPKWASGQPTFSSMTTTLVRSGTTNEPNNGGAGVAVATADVASGGSLSTTAAWTTADQAYLTLMRFTGTVSATPTAVYPWLGALTDTSAKVSVETANATTARLVVSTSATLTTQVGTAPTVVPDAAGYAILPITGLAAGTTYHYGALLNGGTTTAKLGEFRTAPTAGVAASFSFAFGSCWRHDEPGQTDVADPLVFERITARAPLLFLQTGDFHYGDVNTTSVADHRAKLRTIHSKSARVRTLLATIPTLYVPSDHDTAGDGAHAGSTGTPASKSAYRERVPMAALPAAGTYQTFAVGRVRFILLDSRTFRSAPGVTDGVGKVLLGATQEQWVKDTITGSSEPLVFLVSDVPWPPQGTQDDHWGSYATEQTRLVTWLNANRGGRKVHFLTGDSHMLAVDDGLTWTDTARRGYGTWNAGPLAHPNNSIKGGPWSGGTVTAHSQQYGYVDVVDNGSTITATFTGRRADTDASILTATVGVTSGATVLRWFGDTYERRQMLTRNDANTAWEWI